MQIEYHVENISLIIKNKDGKPIIQYSAKEIDIQGNITDLMQVLNELGTTIQEKLEAEGVVIPFPGTKQ